MSWIAYYGPCKCHGLPMTKTFTSGSEFPQTCKCPECGSLLQRGIVRHMGQIERPEPTEWR